MASRKQPRREVMGGLAKGLAVIGAFRRDRPALTLSEVASRTQLPPATARRCLHTLEELGFVMRSGRTFLLRPKVLELGAAYLESMDIEALTSTLLDDLAQRTGDSAALSVLDGKIIGQCQQRHTHAEWLKFLRKIDRETPKDKTLHLIADNYATHKHPAVQQWLAKHPRFNMHFTPTSASWLNMVERFFRDLTTERLRRGVFTSVPELIAAIDEYVAHHNHNPKPFIWTKSARDILQKVIRANSRLSSKQNGTLH